MDHLPSTALPNDHCLALVGDADAGNAAGTHLALLDSFFGKTEGVAPNVLRVMLHPPQVGIMLFELTLRACNGTRVPVEHDGARRCRALIDGQNVHRLRH